MNQEEVWKEWTPPFRYEVSLMGQVRVLYPNGGSRLKATRIAGRGYPSFSIFVLVHRAVAAAFLGPAPVGLEVNHKDGSKTNNNVENLEYATRQENAAHAARLGLMPSGDRNWMRANPDKVLRGSAHPSFGKKIEATRGDKNGSRLYPERLKRGSDVGVSKLTEEKVREIRAKYAASGGRRGILSELGREYGVSHVNITAIVKRTTWRHVS